MGISRVRNVRYPEVVRAFRVGWRWRVDVAVGDGYVPRQLGGWRPGRGWAHAAAIARWRRLLTLLDEADQAAGAEGRIAQAMDRLEAAQKEMVDAQLSAARAQGEWNEERADLA